MRACLMKATRIAQDRARPSQRVPAGCQWSESACFWGFRSPLRPDRPGTRVHRAGRRTPVGPMEVSVDPASVLPVAPVDGMPMLPVEVPVDPALVMPLPAVLLPGARITTGNSPGRSFRTSLEHGAEASADSVVEVHRRSTRSASTPDGLGLGMVWASAEPASRSAASRASETGEDLFMAYSFSDCCSALKSTARSDRRRLEQAVAEFCSVAHGRSRMPGGNQ